jgi:methionine-rich copper-binding protein CopC
MYFPSFRMINKLWFLGLFMVAVIAGCEGGQPSPAIPPFLISTNPANGATGVPFNQKITATFSEAMDPATISTATFTLMQGTTPVAGTVTYSGTTATFTPTSNLLPNTTYTASVTSGAKDLYGEALVNGVVPNPWSFTTGLTPNTTAPTIISTNPVNAATGVPINQAITATFSEAMDPATITTGTFTLMQGTTPVTGTVTLNNGTTATFTPTSNLLPNTTYTAAVSAGATDLAGNALISGPVPNPWTFTTGTAPNITAPTIILTNPINGATGVAINSTINATFSEAMDPATITIGTFTLTGPPGSTPVSGTVTYDAINHIATFTPAGNLALNATYTAKVSTGAKDLTGNALVSGPVPNPWSFTTALTAPATNQAGVDLEGAESFAVLAGTTVTNNGPTTINGNVGVSPGSTITGFPPGIVNGSTHLNDAAAQQAHSSLTSAFNNVAGRTGAVVVAGGELGGLTLAPGIYASDISSFAITTSDLILDAQGAPNAVFIFQMPSTLNVANNRKITLQGGASADNIFWQVGSTATLGTNSNFSGTILAGGTITIQSGATLHGRALTESGAVILNTNTITGVE